MWDEAAKAFQFEIGDLVAHKTRTNVAMVVVNRALTQCHGGIQRNYATSLVHAPEHSIGSGDPAPEMREYLINESELVAFVSK